MWANGWSISCAILRPHFCWGALYGHACTQRPFMLPSALPQPSLCRLATPPRFAKLHGASWLKVEQTATMHQRPSTLLHADHHTWNSASNEAFKSLSAFKE